MFFERLGDRNSTIRIVWLHGWGVDHNSLMPLANMFSTYDNYLLDLAGFGKTDRPNEIWDTEDYTKSVVDFVASLPKKTTIFVGHSFGGRICIRLASKFSQNADAIVLIGGAGLKHKRGILFRLYIGFVGIFSPILKKIFPFLSKLKIGSSDYRHLDKFMKEIFKKTISENLDDMSKDISLPTLLIYGENDNQTPPYFGETYSKNIKNSEFVVIPKATHYSVIFENNKQTQYLINNFIRRHFND
ncbi:MAG: alpha/beta hydrolase [Rickettsiales bacterium]|nr:alpha/beta hydrolase [Rickettsiales bacterium]